MLNTTLDIMLHQLASHLLYRLGILVSKSPLVRWGWGYDFYTQLMLTSLRLDKYKTVWREPQGEDQEE